jgi:predicted DNA-binding transcriptional regulator AlpA
VADSWISGRQSIEQRLGFVLERRFLGIDELSEYIGIRPQTIRNRLSSGTFPIPAKKVCGRVKFDRKDVESYLDKL